MANDAMEQLMKAIVRAEKVYGDNHKYRHVFSSLREARYAASKVSANADYVSPGQEQALAAAGKAVVPAPADARNPTVPESGPDGGSDGPSSTGDA